MISVVLAAYNGAEYIEEQLDSIANQSLLPDELLIRDDGSSDHTVSIIQNWIQTHPQIPARLLETDKNLGFVENFRTLLRESKGDYVLLCDQDDIWHPDKIEKLYNAVSQNENVLAAGSSFRFMHTNGTPFTVPVRPGYSNQNLIPWNMEKGALNPITLDQAVCRNYFQGCTMIAGRKAIEKMLEIKDSRLPHDWQLSLAAAAEGGLYYLDEQLMDYRIHTGNAIGLPQAKTGFVTRAKMLLQERIRRAVVQDLEDSLNTLQKTWPGLFGKQQQEMLDFCIRYRKAMQKRSFLSYFQLAAHPQRENCLVSTSGYLLGLAFIAGHKFSKGKERV